MMLGDCEEDGSSLSITEMLLKELESEVLKPQNYCDGEQSRDAATPPLTLSWQAALLKPSSKKPLEGQSFMEVLDGEMQNEAKTTKASDPNGLPGCHSNTSVPPPPCTLPNTAVPPPTMMKVPPPVSINVPPPNLQFSRPPFPPMSGPPPPLRPMMPVSCLPVPPPVPPFLNVGYGPVPPGNSFVQVPYYGYCNVNNNASFSELPISVAEIPDTTLAVQLKLKKKKKAKKEPKDTSNGIIFTGSSVKSPTSSSTKPLSAPVEISMSVASILPPPPIPPKILARSPVSSPAEIKMPNLKHVKEHKLVVKLDNRTLKEKAPPVKAPEKKRAVVAEYDSESDDESYDVEAYKKRALHRSITSVRLGENEALPDLYSKLKKLNEELAMLQHNEAPKSSESDSESSSSASGTKLKKMKVSDSKDTGSHRNVNGNGSSTGRLSPLVISDDHQSAQRPNLDVRIRMMMDDKMASPAKVQPSISKRQSLPQPVAPTEELHDPKGRTVAFDSLPPPAAASVVATVKFSVPLDRAPSPFLSEEIYQYWQKESIKFRKFLKKSPKFTHLDPHGRYKFRKSRFAPVTKNTLKSAEALGIYYMLDRKLVKKSESIEKRVSAEHEKTVVSAEIDEDLKRLEAITRELQMLEEEEKRMQMEVIDGKIDDDNIENSSENSPNLSDKMGTLDPLIEVSDELKRLEEIRRQLRELEEEEEEEEAVLALPQHETDCDRGDNIVNSDANEGERINEKKFVASDNDITFNVARLQETLSAELLISDDKCCNNKNNNESNGQSSTKAFYEESRAQIKSFQNELRGVKRSSEGDLISLVMNSVMEELRKDLKSSIANNLLKSQHRDIDEFSKKKRKTAV